MRAVKRTGDTPNPDGLTDAEIVEALRGTDPERREAALAALYPEALGAVLIQVERDSTAISIQSLCDAAKCFAATVFTAQQFARALGIELNWAEPRHQKSPIQVVPGSAIGRS